MTQSNTIGGGKLPPGAIGRPMTVSKDNKLKEYADYLTTVDATLIGFDLNEPAIEFEPHLKPPTLWERFKRWISHDVPIL